MPARSAPAQGALFGPDQGAGSELLHQYIDAPTGTVVGGSVEIQRSIVAERGLGLPKTRNQSAKKSATAKEEPGS